MPIAYELHSNDGLITTHVATSTITIKSVYAIYLKIYQNDIISALEIDGNLELFLIDGTSLIIKNFFTTATGSRLYIQDDASDNSYIEYDSKFGIEEDFLFDFTDSSAHDHIQTSTSFSHQDAQLTTSNAEQILYKELFKKDNFKTDQYEISYDLATEKYVANNKNLNFLEIARNNLEQAKEELEDSTDMLDPDGMNALLDNVLGSMTKSNISKKFFTEDGAEIISPVFLDITGKWQSSYNIKNFLQVGAHFDSSRNYHHEPIPAFSAFELLNMRDKKTAAASNYEKTHGTVKELIFELNKTIRKIEIENKALFSHKTFFEKMKSEKSFDSENILKSINETFTEEKPIPNTYGNEFKDKIKTLKELTTLKKAEELAKKAFTKIDTNESLGYICKEIAKDEHVKTIIAEENNQQHYDTIVNHIKALEKAQKNEDLRNQLQEETSQIDDVEYDTSVSFTGMNNYQNDLSFE